MGSKARVSSHPLVRVVDEVIRLRSRLQTVFAGTHVGSGLSSLEMTVLTAVIEARTPPTVPQIGRSIGHHRQVIQRAANSLVQAGLLAIALNPDHKRAHLMQATAKGVASYARATKRAQEATQGLMQTLESRDCERLAQDLLRLRTRIESYLKVMRNSSNQSTPRLQGLARRMSDPKGMDEASIRRSLNELSPRQAPPKLRSTKKKT